MPSRTLFLIVGILVILIAIAGLLTMTGKEGKEGEVPTTVTETPTSIITETPKETMTQTETTPMEVETPTTTPEKTTSSETTKPEMPILQIGESSIRVSSDFYEFVEKARKGEISVSINFWTSMLPFEVAIVEKVVQKFMEEYPGITVNYQGTTANMKEAVKAGIIAGDVENTAHVFTWAHDWTGELADGGFIVSLSKYLPPETIEDLRKQYTSYAFSAGVYKLELYGLPWAAESIALVCNLDMTGGVFPKTFSELENIMKKWYNPDAGTYGIAWQIDPYHIYPLITAFGGFYYDEDKDEVGVNSEGTKKGFEYLFTKIFPYMYTGDVGHETQLSLFEDGKVPCIVTGPWNMPRIKEKISNLVVGPIPKIEDKTPKPFSGVKLLWVTKAAESSKERLYASILFAMWFSLNDDTLSLLMDQAGFIPVKISVIEYLRENSDRYPVVLGFAESLANSVPMPKSLKMAKVWGPVSEALSSMVTAYNEEGLDAVLAMIGDLLDEAQGKIMEAFGG